MRRMRRGLGGDGKLYPSRALTAAERLHIARRVHQLRCAGGLTVQGVRAALHLNAPAATSQRDSAARHTSKCSGRCSANVQQPGAAGGCSGQCSRAAARLTATGTRMWSWCDNRELLYQLQNRPRPRRPGARGCVVGLTRVAGPCSGAAPRRAGKLGPQPGTARRRCHASASLASAVPSVHRVGGRPRRSWGAYSAAAPCNFHGRRPGWGRDHPGGSRTVSRPADPRVT